METETKLSLLEKLSKITEDLGGLGKGGNNTHNKYNYVKGEDAMKEFRALEVANRIKVIPSVKPETIKVEFTEKGQVTTAVIDYIIHDLDSKDTITVSIIGQGYDSTDKSAYKLATGAFKYFLLQTFSYSTDDPEKEDNKTVNHSVGKAKATPIVPVKEAANASDGDVEVTSTGSGARFKAKGGFSPVKPVINQSQGFVPTSTPTASVEVTNAVGPTSFSPAMTNGSGKTTFKTTKFSDYVKKQQ